MQIPFKTCESLLMIPRQLFTLSDPQFCRAFDQLQGEIE